MSTLVVLVFAAYLVALVKITLVKGTTFPRLLEHLLEGRAPLRAVNLVPFETIRDYLWYRQGMPFLRWFSNLAGNLLIFVPLGLYLPIVFKAMRRLPAALAVIVIVSLSLEGLQYVLGTGSTDIDDLLLNTVGGVLGYGLFAVIATPTTARATALLRTLAISLGFAVSAYTVAYQEFGLYLGLATLRETVQGGESIPARPADVSGVVSGGRDHVLILTRSVRGAEPPEVDVEFGPDTRFYDRQVSLSGHTQSTRYVPYAPEAAAGVPLDALANAWGRWDGGRLIADVVWTMRPSEAGGPTAVMTGMREAAPGPGLPASDPVLEGHVKSVVGDDVVIYRIQKMTKGHSMFAASTSIEAAFRLSPDTVFHVKRILRGGQEVHLLSGSRGDLANRAMVQVWGPVRDGHLLAAVVCVNVFK